MDYRIRAQSMVQPEDIKEKSSRRNDQKKSDGDSSSKSTHAMFKSPKRLDDRGFVFSRNNGGN